MCSFPYVRDWLNEHPFRNEPNARLICNLYNGSQIAPKTLWNMMEQLKRRIGKMLDHDELQVEIILPDKKTVTRPCIPLSLT